MSDYLRYRIAAAIYKDNDFGWSKYMCEEAADAVIAELRLREEVDLNCTDEGETISLYRYVTDWNSR